MFRVFHASTRGARSGKRGERKISVNRGREEYKRIKAGGCGVEREEVLESMLRTGGNFGTVCNECVKEDVRGCGNVPGRAKRGVARDSGGRIVGVLGGGSGVKGVGERKSYSHIQTENRTKRRMPQGSSSRRTTRRKRQTRSYGLGGRRWRGTFLSFPSARPPPNQLTRPPTMAHPPREY